MDKGLKSTLYDHRHRIFKEYEIFKKFLSQHKQYDEHMNLYNCWQRKGISLLFEDLYDENSFK